MADASPRPWELQEVSDSEGNPDGWEVITGAIVVAHVFREADAALIVRAVNMVSTYDGEGE